MGGWQTFQLPDGYMARGWRFEVETTSPAQQLLIHQHFGARRFAYNWALARVKADLDAQETDRRHLVLPVIGKVRSKENTRRLERLVAKGRARVLSMTLSEQGGRLFVSVATIVSQAPRRPREPHGRCGIDVGIGTEWAVVARADDTIERVVHPTPWTATRAQRRRVARRISRRVVGSRGHRQAKAKLAALDRRAANLRRESLHVLTARLATRYGTITAAAATAPNLPSPNEDGPVPDVGAS